MLDDGFQTRAAMDNRGQVECQRVAVASANVRRKVYCIIQCQLSLCCKHPCQNKIIVMSNKSNCHVKHVFHVIIHTIQGAGQPLAAVNDHDGKPQGVKCEKHENMQR